MLTAKDISVLMESVGGVVKTYVERAVGPLLARLKSLEEVPPGRDGKDGANGKDGKDGATGPAGPDGAKGIDGAPGRDGVDGKDGSPGPKGEKGDVGERGPPGERGEKGEPGGDGSAGPAGDDGHDGKDGAAGERGPPGERGEKGEPGAPGQPGERGERGEKGEVGQDGRSVTVDDLQPLIEGLYSKWALGWEQRAMEVLQRALDRIEKPKDGVPGKDGKDGRDAFDLEDFEAKLLDDGRTLVLAYVRGSERLERSIVLNHILDRGVWKQSRYLRGDAVSFGGSVFIAQRDTESKPETDDSWRLAVKRGRDGRDGKDGEPVRSASAKARVPG